MAYSDQRFEDRITGKIILRANLTNETPLLAGKGEGDAVDQEVMTWPGDGRPYLPASALAGCLKSHFKRYEFPDPDQRFWSEPIDKKKENTPPQSHIRFDDLLPEPGEQQDIVLRDGVRIDPETGTAKDGAKYNYQVVEPGVVFPFRAEITIRHGMKADDAKAIAGQIYAILDSDDFRVGAFTNTGFGKLKCTDFQAWYFDFPKDAGAWFNYLENKPTGLEPLDLVKPALTGIEGVFSIEAAFQLKTSLIVGAYGIDGDEPDKSHLKSRGQYALPGKSIRGALRHRALRILKTLGDLEAEHKINDLFGIVKEEEKIQKKGRLRIEESILDKTKVTAMVQDRIRIDRFTGGTMSGALFNSQPIWAAAEEGQKMVSITFSIREKANSQEKKLLLMLLKDLWLEDLPIGGEKNVGRGVLCGLTAIIKNEGEVVETISKNGSGLAFETGGPDALNRLIQPEPDKTEVA